PDLANGCIDSLFDVNEYVLAPQFTGDLLTRDQLSSLVDQEHHQLQREAFEPHRAAGTAKLKAAVIQLKFLETDFLIWQCTTPMPFVTRVWAGGSFHLRNRRAPKGSTNCFSTVFGDVRNLGPPDLPCQAPNHEFSSDQFRPLHT